MKLIQWTLFIDMLGYRDMNGEINNEEQAREFIDFMEENKKIFDSQNSKEIKARYEKDVQFNLYDFYKIKYAFVSDSLIVTYYPKESPGLTNKDKMYMHSANALFIILIRIQTFIFNCFSQKGIFLRGGISNGYCYIKDGFVVGDGLIEAYKVESEIAKNPRIALSSNVTKNRKLMNNINKISAMMYGGNSIIRTDEDEVGYLDYLVYNLSSIDPKIPMVLNFAKNNQKEYLSQVSSVRVFLEKHSAGIKFKLTELHARLNAAQSEQDTSGIEKVISKFEWLMRYHNSSLENTSFKEYIVDTL